MAVLFFVKRGERILGPTRLADLFQHAASGRLRANDLVGESPKGPWLPARQLDELEDAWASSRDATEAAAAEDDSEWDRMYREHEETEAALGEPLSEKTAASGSRNTVLLWSLLGGFLVLLLGLIGGGVAMLWSGGVLASKPSSPQPVALSESDSDFKRALRLDAAARVLDRANAWVADAEVFEHLRAANPAAARAILERFDEARDRGLWHSRRNALPADALMREAAE